MVSVASIISPLQGSGDKIIYVPRANTLKTNLYDISVLEPYLRLSAHSYAFRGASEDNVARHESHAATEKGYHLSYAEDLVCRVPVLCPWVSLAGSFTVSLGRMCQVTYLNGLSVDFGPDLEILGIFNNIARHNGRTKRRPAVKCLAERPLASSVLELPVSVRYIVANGVSKNIVERLSFGHI